MASRKATTRRSRPASRVPTPVFARMNGICVDGLHLWCPGTDGRSGAECLCRCHSGHTTGSAA
jgi:hypothetical protein